jgi:hypothetical protein
VTASVQNVRQRAWITRTGVFGLVMILPLSIAGVTVRPALVLREVQHEEARLAMLADHCAQRRVALDDFGPLEQIAIFEGLRARLHDLVPAGIAPIESYSHLRSAARVAGVELGSIRLEDPTDTGLELDGLTIAQRPVSVNGTATQRALVHLVAGLDARGLPVAVTNLVLQRNRRGQATFRFEMTLGLFHYAPTGSLGSEFSDSSQMDAPMPGGE